MSNRRSLAIIFSIIFVNLLGFGIIIPLLPLYAQEFEASALQIGLLFASYSLCQIVAAPLLGGLSDRYGRRPILLVSLLGTVISFGMLALANSLVLLFAARIVDGLSGGNISTARAYISDITEEKDRAKAFGIIGAAFGLGFVFGPALAGVLGRYGHAAPAWGAAILAVLALILTYIWLPETRQVQVHVSGRRSPWRDLPAMVTRPVLGRLLLIDFVYWAALSVYQTTFALFGNIRFGWEITQVGYTLAMIGFIGALVQGGAVGPVVKRFGEKNTFISGLLLAMLGLGIAAVTYDWRLFVAALIPAAIGGALSNPTLISMISHTGGRAEQGRVQGVSGAMESLGRTIGPIWGNGVLGALGEGPAYLSAALALGLLAFWSAMLPLGRKAESEDGNVVTAPVGVGKPSSYPIQPPGPQSWG
jgi:DHA1 family tetracycline resistance protein-like MFS transporter